MAAHRTAIALPRRFRALARGWAAGTLALAFALIPLAAEAEGVAFTVPDHYLVLPSPPALSLPGTYRAWARFLDGTRHSIVVSSSPATRTLAAELDATVASVSARHAIDVARSDGAPLCGMPSMQLSYAYANQLTYLYRYAVVGDRMLIASYAHPVGTAADPSAVASLDTLCSGIHQPRTPAGWTITSPYPPNGSAWTPAAGGTALLMQIARPTKNDGTPLVPFSGPGTMMSTAQQACGATAIRRTTVKSADGANLLEYASGTAYAYDYVVAYKRPAADAADANAMALLTSFCEGTLPPS
ncbi:MAG TPA: hypothetical protein VHS78_15110 [Candidatus Elarobacter sp.]|jgi:hypothetical protein|nr:hypothetical protein [Candidatus Elarobacter sp.]